MQKIGHHGHASATDREDCGSFDLIAEALLLAEDWELQRSQSFWVSARRDEKETISLKAALGILHNLVSKALPRAASTLFNELLFVIGSVGCFSTPG